MVSRRKILSRSMDDLNLDQTYAQEEEEDVWYQKEKLYKEHIQEVLNKWTQIDDEIWAKVIVFERNRRVAKAYARAPCLTINGANDGFDGMKIGLCGFENPMRDTQTDEVKKRIDQGAKIKMDDYGNIFIKRYGSSNVFVKSTALNPNDENSIGTDILKLQNQALEKGETYKLFDMRKFHHNMNAEFRRSYPDRQRLETQCLSALVFVKQENDILDCPVWILVINVVAMALLKSKLAPIPRSRPTPLDIKNRPRIPIPDEDPYSIAAANNSLGYISGNTSISSTRQQLLIQSQKLAQKRSEKPPKLPPRDNGLYGHDIPKPDYDDLELENKLKLSRTKNGQEKERNGKDKKYDDPYYCGLRARVPNFVKSKSSSKGEKEKKKEEEKATAAALANAAQQQQLSKKELQQQARSQKKTSMIHHPSSSTSTTSSAAAAAALYHQQQQLVSAGVAHYPHYHAGNHHLNHHIIWQSKSYDSGMDSPDNTIESPYNRIYGRLPLPTRGYVPGPRVAYIGEWD